MPWPLTGIAACWGLSLFEEPGEAIFMFGSITMIFLLPIAYLVNSMWLFGTLSCFVWLLVLCLPTYMQKSPIRLSFNYQAILACQSLFAAIQAGTGFLIVLGRTANLHLVLLASPDRVAQRVRDAIDP